MRRKLFFIFLIVISIIFFLDYLEFDLNPISSKILSLDDIENSYQLKVCSYKEDSEKITLTCKITEINGKDVNFKGNVILKVYSKDIPGYMYLYNLISYSGSFSVPQGKRNPHCFNYRKYLLGKNVYLSSYVSYSPNIIDSEKTFLEKLIYRLNVKKEEFSDYLSEDTRGLLLGILFGDVKDLDEDIYDSFRLNGTSHILAISGLHIGIIYGFLEKLSKKKQSILFKILICSILYLYGSLSMWSISITRAILMIYLKMIAKEFDLRYDTLTSLSLVGLILIVINPYVVFLTSFQLSFLAVISICVIYPILSDKVPSLIKTSLSVTLGALGYQSYVFNYITPLSIIVNIPVIIISTYLVPIAFIMYFIYIFLGKSFVLFKILDLISRLLIFINKFSTIDGISCIETSSRVAIFFIIFSITLFIYNFEYIKILRLRKDKQKLKRVFILILCIILLFSFINYDPISYDDIVFIDVGQGDAIHIRCNNINILIDGGGNVNYNIGENTLKPYFLKNGVSKINLSLLTHTHTDHYQGFLELKEVFRIRKFVTNSLMGDKYIISKDVYIKTLWPNDATLSKDENENCSVFMLYYKGVKVLITGDLDEKGEEYLMKYYTKDELKCDILKIGHHGSSTSSSIEFLKYTNPKYAVIQVGKNNYGHPSNDTLYKLNEIGAIILRNDLNGAIGFKVTSNGIKFHKVID